jgi:1-acyl-sn-glycerol-3-phosphate acyltransferase
VGDAASSAVQTVLKPMKALGFPYRKPTVPKGVEVPDDPSKLGANFDTDWAAPRRPRRCAPCSPTARCV